MSFINKIGNTIFNSDGNMSTHVGGSSISSNGVTSDFEIPKIGNDTFHHNGKMYTRLGNTLFSSDGKSWTGNDMDDDAVRGIISNEK